MPVTNGIGHSTVTPDKEDGFGAYVSLHMKIVSNVFNRHSYMRRQYIYIDINAGSGDNPEEGVDGSPILFVNKARRRRMRWEAYLIEREIANVELLREQVDSAANVYIYHEDNRIALPRILESIPKKTYGLIYSDPNGIPDWDLLLIAARLQPKMDLLVRCPTRAIKRARYQGHMPLTDALQTLNKEVWLIRDTLPGDRWDWTFLFGTNYTDIGEWGKNRFYRTDKKRGQQILERLNYTQKEIKTMHQGQLFVIEQVQERSHGICEVCHLRKATEIHHIKGSYGLLDANKRKAVCHECHCDLEGMEE
jgi:hypothetical protein